MKIKNKLILNFGILIFIIFILINVSFYLVITNVDFYGNGGGAKEVVQFFIILFLILLLAIGMVFAFSIHISKKFIEPLNEIQEYSEKIGKGDYSNKFDLDRQHYSDEVNSVILALEKMQDEIRQSQLKIKDDAQKIQENIDLKMKIVRDQVLVEAKEKENHDLHEVVEKLKVTEDELRLQKQDIEGKVNERTKELEIEKENINRLLRQKNEFINELSHDLRTPLTPLSGLLHIMKDQAKDEDTEKDLQICIRNVDYLATLIRDVLELARLESDRVFFDLKDVNIRDFVESIVPENVMIFERSKIYLENNVNDNIFVCVDRNRIREVFNNLLDNARKFTPEGGKVEINLSTVNGFAKISIKDTGIGMKSETVNNIFTEFYKGDESRHDISGFGLGTSICRKIITRHGGNIWAESPGEGKGSTFHLTLPLSKNQNLNMDD